MKALHILTLFGIWAGLSLPGNIATFYFLGTQKNEDLSQTVIVNDTFKEEVENFNKVFANQTEPEPQNVTFTCYENIREYSVLRIQAKFWLEGIGIATSGTIGLLGNSMSAIVLNNYSSNRSFNNLLISLSIVDNLLIIFTMLEKAIFGCFLKHTPAWFVQSYPLFWHPVKGMIHTAAIYMVVAVSAERFRAMCFPMRKRIAFYKFVAFVVLLSVTVEIPRFFQFHLVGEDYWTTPLMENPSYVRISSIWDDLLVSGLVPLIALIYFNARIYWKIRCSTKFEYRFVGSGTKSSDGEKKSSRSSQDKDDLSEKPAWGLSEPPVLQYQSVQPKSENDEDTCEMIRREDKNGRRLSEGLVKWRQYEDSTTWTDVPKEYIKPVTSTVPIFPRVQHCEINTASSLPFLSSATEPIAVGNHPDEAFELRPIVPKVMAPRPTLVGSSGILPSTGTIQFRKKQEKSARILVAIVVAFIMCHCYRMALKTNEFLAPNNHLEESFTYCYEQGKYHIPVALYILHNCHHLFLVINSSVNFVIYCFVAQEFRGKLYQLVRKTWLKIRGTGPSSNTNSSPTAWQV